MQAVILAAGRGKRMGKLTLTKTKPMLKIKGRPILEYKIDALPKKIKEIIFIVGYHSIDIISHFKKQYAGRRITYIFQGNLNGTGGALHLAKSVLRDKFLVMMGDDLYYKKDLNNLLKYNLAIMGYEVDEANKFGVIRMDRRKNMTDVLEKPKHIKRGFANTGVYILNDKFFDYKLVPIGSGEFGLPQTMAQMARNHKIKVVKAERWHPISNEKDLETAERIINNFL
jgi:NDP-sugar pyrophosphorylase family protein